MSGLYSHTERIDGESIDETKYNSDHQNHIDNHIPEMMDDYSATATEMRTEADPGESGSESLATSLAGELERLRYAIRELKGTTYWYESPAIALSAAHRQNFLINGGFDVWQRALSFHGSSNYPNDDNTLIVDGWRLLSDGDDIVDVDVALTGPSESDSSAKFTVATANTKWGICQFVENADSLRITQGSQKASMSFYARCNTSGTTTRLRAAIIEWTGTGDDCTTDIVSAWEAQGTNPTLVTDWAYASTPSTLSLTDTLTEFTITNVNLSDSATNVGVFIWADDTATTVGDEVHLAAVQLVRGGDVGIFPWEPFADVLRKCQRRFAKTYNHDIFPPASSLLGALTTRADSTANFYFTWDFPVTMMATPTLVTYNPSTGSTTGARNVTDGTDTGALTTVHAGQGRVAFERAGAGHTGDLLAVHATATVDF